VPPWPRGVGGQKARSEGVGCRNWRWRADGRQVGIRAGGEGTRGGQWQGSRTKGKQNTILVMPKNLTINTA
jgi:hypothetical protein